MRRPDDTLEVWPDNAATWDAWLGLDTQWRRVVGLAGERFEGLIYASFDLALEMAGVTQEQRPQVLQGLRYMERIALPILNGDDEDHDD